MDLELSFGSWLTRRRGGLGLSRAELARRVSCATVTLRKIEEDARRPSTQLAARLADQLAVRPEECATFIRVARGELGFERLPRSDRPAFGASRLASGAPPTQLPVPPTPLIGRTAEVTAVRDVLLRGDVRLLTLTGAPGIGKTRLSLAVALDLRGAFVDGVSFISLAPLRDPSLVVATIAQTLGIAERAGQPMLERLKAYVRDRQLLLILDNFEHLLAAAPHLAELLAAARQLTLLITSRVALRLVGEHRFPVPPLAAPERAQHLPNDVFARYAAIDLFIQRARAVDPCFTLDDANAQVVGAICVRLDGLPLAIELAATRISLFTPPELLARLDRRLALLTEGALDLPARQQTLRRAIDWSYDLLDEGEQALLRRLGVFVGGWTLEAVEPVCNATGDVGVGGLEGSAALVDRSLVQHGQGSDGGSRFTLLETIREYALDRLEASGESDALRRQHAEYFLGLAEAAEPQLWASDQLRWLNRLEHEHDNLRAALAWAIEHDAAVALRIAGALASFWDTRGYHSEGRRWLERALTRTAPPAHGAMETDHIPALCLSADVAAYAKALHGAGLLAHAQEDNARAEALFTQGLALARASGDSRRIALLLNDLAEQALHRGDVERATTLCAEGLPLARESGDRSATARLLLRSAELAWEQGNFVSAVSCYDESLTLLRALDDRRGLTWALLSRGQRAQAQGERQAAAELFAEGLVLARSIGDQENTAWLLYETGRLLLEQRDLGCAAARFVESARLLHWLGADYGVAVNLAGLAAVLVQHQQPAQATGLLSLAAAHGALVGGDDQVAASGEHAEFERTVEIVRAQLDAQRFAGAWSEGRTMTLEQAIAYALRTDPE